MAPTDRVLPTVLALGLIAAAGPAFAQDPAGTGARQKALREAGLTAPLTLLPARVLGRPDANVADVLGLVLEQYGMRDLDVARQPFVAPADATWEQVPDLLAAHVRERARTERAAAGRWHLYAEYLGDRRSGPTEVRFVLTDGSGALVYSDRKTPDDPAFQRTAGRDPDPLGCSALVADRLFTLAGWTKAPRSVRDGRFARLWREKSGTPDKAELAAMKERKAALRAGLAKTRFAVLPVVVPDGHDAGSAERIARLVGTELGCEASAKGGARLTVAPSSNQQKRLWDLAAAAARAALSKQAADADYVLVADLGVHPEGGVHWAHVVVCRAAGDVVLADFLNDQHPWFRRRAPKTLADAEALVAARLAELLR
jgi:hypothetical protein